MAVRNVRSDFEEFVDENTDMDGDLDTIKLKIPNFQGENDPEAYLEWEKR